jgi:hypothetical protein
MNTLFIVSLIVEAIFGIGFILVPANLLAPMGVTLNNTSTTFACLFGSAIISFPFILYLARKSDNLIFKKSVVNSMFVYFSISTLLLFITQINGQMNTLGWSVISLHFVLTVWFGYYLVK